MKERVTLAEYKTELENELLTASPVQDDINENDFQLEMSEYEAIKSELFNLETPENAEHALACRNCNLDGQWTNLPCDFCSYGGNMPPN